MNNNNLTNKLINLPKSQEFIEVPKVFSGLHYDFLISLNRLSEETIHEQIPDYKLEYRWDINTKNTASDTLGRYFIGTNGYLQTLELNELAGFSAPSLREMKEFLNLLKKGSTNEISVFNYTKKDFLKRELCNSNLEDVFGQSTKARAEILNTTFTWKFVGKRGKDILGLSYDGNWECLDNNTLLGESKIDFESWLETATRQGLPSKETKSGKMESILPERAFKNHIILFAHNEAYGFGRIFFKGGLNNPSEFGVRSVIRYNYF